MRAFISRISGIAAIILVVAAAAVLMGEQAPTAENARVPLVQDWTHHHLIYSAPQSIFQNLQVEQQPRYFQQYLRRNMVFRGPMRPPIFDPLRILRRGTRQMQRDWGVVLAMNSVQPAGTFPAKITWNATASPDCNRDVVVYLTGLAGTGGTTVDIFGLNNLYVNATGTGYCAGPTAPTVLWSYHANVNGTGKPNSSVVVSFAGDQLAWIEGGSGGAAILHVLRPGTGAQGTLAAPLNMSTLPAAQYTTSGATYVTCKATPANACELHLAFGDGYDDTASSPYYDGALDAIFVGDIHSHLHEFTNVFKGAPAEAGGNWPIAMHGGTTVMGSPVYDETSGNVFVGDAAGDLRAAITKTGTCNGAGTIPCRGNQSYAVGGNTEEGPIVDSTTEEVFAFGTGAGGGAVVGEANANVVGPTQPLQMKQTVVSVGAGTNHLYAGDFDNDYYTTDTSLATASGFLYVCGNNGGGGGGDAEIRRITITAGLLAGVNATNYPATTGASVCSPVTVFDNNATGVEYIFFSVVGQNAADTAACGTAHSCILAMTVTTGTFTTTPVAGLLESGGTSGIIVDNDGSGAGESSVYFTPLGNASATYPCNGTTTPVGCAVKATQANLN